MKTNVDEGIRYFEQLEEMFATQGWRNLVEEAKGQVYQYQADALEAPNWERLCEIRGEVLQLSRIANLEEVTALLKAQYIADARDADDNADL